MTLKFPFDNFPPLHSQSLHFLLCYRIYSLSAAAGQQPILGDADDRRRDCFDIISRGPTHFVLAVPNLH